VNETGLVQSVNPDLDDLLSAEAVNEPFTYYKRLRDTAPVYWNARWNGWIFTDYQGVVAAYRDHDRLSSDRFAGPFGDNLTTKKSDYEQLIEFLNKFFVWKDQPYHTHIRTLVNKAFTPKSVEVLRPRVKELVRSLAEPLRGRKSVDFLAEFAFGLPVIVIAEYLGVPAEARQQVREWSEDLGAVIFVQGHSADRFAAAEIAMGNLVDLIRPIVRDRRHDPKDDLISGMVHATVDGDLLSDEEVIANAVLMVFAGHETTMNLLANGIVAFDKHPGEWDRLRNDPTMARTAVEEVLRYDGPIRAMARWAKEPFEFRGQLIAQNDRLLLVQHAANHDPQIFENPDFFDPGRWPNKHLAFGQGIHTCLGAPLARLEAQEAYAYLADQFSSIEVLTKDLDYNPTIVSRSLKRLQVSFHA